MHATVACLLVHYCRVFNLRANSGFCIDRNPTRRPEPTSEFLKDWVRHSRMASELCLAPARPKQDWIRRAVREGSQTGASFGLCPLGQAEWLEQTADQIKDFTADAGAWRCLLLEASSPRCLQVRDWAKVVLKAKNPRVEETLQRAEAQRLQDAV